MADPVATQTFRSAKELRIAAIDRHQNGDPDTARILYRRYLTIVPKDAAIWSNLGALFRSEQNYDMAATCQRRALHLDPGNITLLNNAANALYDSGDVEEALAIRQQAIAKDPGNADHYANLAKCLRGLGRHKQAVAELEKGIRIAPEEPELHIQMSFALLALGDYQKGFTEFEWRWKGDEISPPDFDFPQWQGEDIEGKTILVSPEQGFGDTVLMARFLAQLLDLGCSVKLLCKTPLRRLFAEMPGVDGFIDTRDQLAGCDVWAPMMDLPRYLGTTLDTLPAPAHLAIPADSITRAKAILKPFDDVLKIGVLWSGSVTYRANHKRSFSHRKFLRLATIPGVQLFSLYKGTLTDAFHEDGTSCIIFDAASNDRDFADSAALIQKLDLVITMDSAIAHVSGSLNIPVWNLLHSEAYWLYEPFRDHTPWYPSMRLIRQPGSGDWDAVFDQLVAEITERAQEHRK
ncbi:MAG: tetratricopeptide repeat-containing glycosyltransferase family protein [Pseudomonadota bacterium]